MTPSLRTLILVAIVCASLVPVTLLRSVHPEPNASQTTRHCRRIFLLKAATPTSTALPLKDTRVDVAITGVIADVTVRQIYENRGQRPLHARYVFPARRAPPSTA